jgi:hypothetical protein
MTTWLGALGLGLMLGLATSPAAPVLACSCLPPPPVPEALEGADVVFRGTVQALRRVSDDSAPLPGFRTVAATLSVAATWKGEALAERVVFTSGDGASCGYPFRLGDDVIVYGFVDEADPQRLVSTNLCSRSRAFARDEAAALDAAVASTPTAEPTPGPSATPMPVATRSPCPACPQPAPDRDAMARHAAVFRGQVRGAAALGPAGNWGYEVSFDVLDVWKGDVHAVEALYVPAVAWHCGQAFQHLGETWLIFADEAFEADRSRFRLGTCNPSLPFQPELGQALGASCEPPHVTLAAPMQSLSAGESTRVQISQFGIDALTVTLRADPPELVETVACTVPDDPGQCRGIEVKALQQGVVSIDVLSEGERCRCAEGRCGPGDGSASAREPLVLRIEGSDGGGTPTAPPAATPTPRPPTPGPSPVPATFDVRGRVLDAASGANVAGATVNVTISPGACEPSVVTLRDGFFSRGCSTELPALLEVSVAADGYEDWERSFALPAGSTWTRLLQVSLVPLDVGDGPIYLPLTARDVR